MRKSAWISAAVVLTAAVLLFLQNSFAEEQEKQNKAKAGAGRSAALLEKYPEADADGDGTLTREEFKTYRKALRMTQRGSRAGAKDFNKLDPEFDSGWDKADFPEDAVFKKSPEEIKAIYEKVVEKGEPVVMSYEKPADGALRIIGTGHSFMIPGYNTIRMIAKGAGFKDQPLYTHCGGGITGSARFKWEQENGIFDFEGNPPVPKLLASLANAEWDVMTWGPYYNDRPEFFTCWIDFATKYNPNMKFYLSDSWPFSHMFRHLGKVPESEDYFTEELIDEEGRKQRENTIELIKAVREKTIKDVYVLPTSDAMVIAAKMFVHGKLPEVEGLHTVIGKKEQSLWSDRVGHLGPGFDLLEGYVFYATIYGRSPELIKNKVKYKNPEYPGEELDRAFRKIAWQAVTGHPLSGVVDENNDGLAD